MELTIYRENECWAARVGKYKFESSNVIPLVPASGSLYRLVTAIHNIYPGSRVWIDPDITNNPFLRLRLFTDKYYSLLPSYDEIQYTLDNPEVKICKLCEGRAYYHLDSRDWVCGNQKCAAHEFKGTFYKLSKHAKR